MHYETPQHPEPRPLMVHEPNRLALPHDADNGQDMRIRGSEGVYNPCWCKRLLERPNSEKLEEKPQDVPPQHPRVLQGFAVNVHAESKREANRKTL